MRSIFAAACLALVVVSCGDGELTLTEYAAQLEELVAAMNQEIDALDAELESQILTVEGVQSYLDAKTAVRHELLDGFEALAPPEEAAEMHAAALEMVGKLTSAEEDLARRVGDVETTEELNRLWDTPEGRAATAVDDEAVEFCQAAQAQFDATAEREVFDDVPWIPSELQEVVLVFFGCVQEERIGGS